MHMENVTEIVRSSEDSDHRTIEQYYKGAGSVSISNIARNTRIYNMYRKDDRKHVEGNRWEGHRPRILDLLESTRKKIDSDSERFSSNISLEKIKISTQRTIYELSQYNPVNLILEVTYEDSVYIKALFKDFNVYLEVLFEEEKEDTYMFSLYRNKICVASFEGQGQETYSRIRREIQKVKDAQYRITVLFNSSVYNNAISQPSTTSQGI